MPGKLCHFCHSTERLITMTSDKHGIKDQVTGKAKELKGKLTNNKKDQAKGKVQQLIGKAKDKAADLKDNLNKDK